MPFIPDYEEPEVVEPEEAPALPAHSHEAPPVDPEPLTPTTGRSAAMEAIVRGLSEPPPCPVCGRVEPCRCATPADYSRVEAQARMVEASLIRAGILAGPEVDDQPDIEEVAQFLAERSGFARYTVEGGWRRLLQSEQDVDVAVAKAMPRVMSGDVDLVKAARAALIDWQKAKHDLFEWCAALGVRIMDPDGWRGADGIPFETPIDRAEFDRRLVSCTVDLRPPEER